VVLDLTSDYWLHNAAAAPSAECRLSADVDDRQTHGQRHQVSVPLLGAGVIKKLSLAGSRRTGALSAVPVTSLLTVGAVGGGHLMLNTTKDRSD